MNPTIPLEKMRDDWDARAKENARHFVATGQEQWDDDVFFESGRETTRNYILIDMDNVCQGRNPKDMRVIEIGCGAGRVTRALAEVFGEVYAVDVSGEMVALARQATAGMPNAYIYQNNGMDLSPLPALPFDFAFSCIVFQHIPSREVIESYVQEVARLLRPGSLFKFQMQGAPVEPSPDNTWVGVGYSEEQARELAERAGLLMELGYGAGTQDYWLWFFKPLTQAA